MLTHEHMLLSCKMFRRLRRRRFLSLAGFTLISIAVWIIDNENTNSDNTPKALMTTVTLWKEKEPIIIKWFDLENTKDNTITCKHSLRCHVTANESVRHQHDLLGILFYGAHFTSNGFPLPRKPGHLWSVHHIESPKFNYFLFPTNGTMNLFNLTSTFSRNSHYPIPTVYLERERDLTSTKYMVSVQKKNQLRKEGLAPIVFVHSDCSTPSDRSHYIRLLMQHIPIDSYGPCEHNKDFPSENLTFKSASRPWNSPDFKRLLAQYKFAFAFENAVCDDYITEKFWRPLEMGVVPLVFGSPKIKDLAPTDHSVIDIRDYSVKELADYITYLDTHDEEYSKYLDFKRAGITNPTLRKQLDRRDWGPRKPYIGHVEGFQCFICEKLHKLKRQMFSNQTVEQWHGKHDHYTCAEPKIFDEIGKYVDDNLMWTKIYHDAKYYLHSIKYHIDKNVNVESPVIRKFAQDLQKTDLSKF